MYGEYRQLCHVPLGHYSVLSAYGVCFSTMNVLHYLIYGVAHIYVCMYVHVCTMYAHRLHIVVSSLCRSRSVPLSWVSSVRTSSGR